jgi:hypothetical protein
VFANAEFVSGRNGYEPIGRLAQDNRAAHFLRSRGYRFVHVRSSAQPTIRNPYADEQVSCKGSLFEDEYFRTLTEISWLKALGSVATSDLAECHKQRLQVVGDQARKPGRSSCSRISCRHTILISSTGRQRAQACHLSNQFDFQAQLWEDKHGTWSRFVSPTVADRADRPHRRRVGASADHHRAVRPRPEPRGRADRRAGQGAAFANFAAYLLPGAPRS